MRLGTEENRDKKCDWGTRKRPLKSVCRVVRWTSNLPSITFSNFHHYPFLSLLNFRLSLTLKYILLIYFYHIVFIFFWERERETPLTSLTATEGLARLGAQTHHTVHACLKYPSSSPSHHLTSPFKPAQSRATWFSINGEWYASSAFPFLSIWAFAMTVHFFW